MKFAFYVSRFLDPLWVIPAVTMLQAYPYGFRLTFMILIGMLGIPLVLRLLYQPSGWDISDRAHRPKAIAMLLLLGLVNILIAWAFGNASLDILFIFYELWLLGFFFVSLFWKISGHAGGITLAAGLIIRWYGWAWWPIFLLVPVMGWARVKTHDHTIAQVTAAVLYSWSMLVLYETWQSVF